jgi:hypothetical protein
VEKDVEASTSSATVEFGGDAEEATVGRVLEGVTCWKEELHLGRPGIGGRRADGLGSTEVIWVW